MLWSFISSAMCSSSSSPVFALKDKDISHQMTFSKHFIQKGGKWPISLDWG